MVGLQQLNLATHRLGVGETKFNICFEIMKSLFLFVYVGVTGLREKNGRSKSQNQPRTLQSVHLCSVSGYQPGDFVHVHWDLHDLHPHSPNLTFYFHFLSLVMFSW